MDDWEIFLDTDPNNFNDTPIDTDRDKKPDGDLNNSQPWMDLDDDNDGFNDKDELEADADPTNPDDYPKKDNNFQKINYMIYLISVFIIIIILIFLFIILKLKKKKK